jgi:galactose mutarotase-like enzyme
VASLPDLRVEASEVAGLPAYVLHDTASDLHSTWVPAAGMLGASLVHAGEELLWQGEGVGAYARARTFMGIPFLHPWANRLAGFGYRVAGRSVSLDPASPLLLQDDHGLPIHGVLTGRAWSAAELGTDANRARLVATLDFDGPELLTAFPFPHRLRMEIQLGGGMLEVGVTVTPTGEDPVPISFGFHPYLQIPRVPRSQWEVDFPVERHLLMDSQQIPTGETETVAAISGAIGDRHWDDGYDRLRGRRFALRGGGRTIAVEFTEGYRVAQIFVPPGQEYICVEPMTAAPNALDGPDDALRWATPGRPYSASFRIVT